MEISSLKYTSVWFGICMDIISVVWGNISEYCHFPSLKWVFCSAHDSFIEFHNS